MKKTKRSAFTIVELVIVIAVIAILSAVLIPTFGSIIKNANVAADQSTAATLTTELHIYLKGETIDNEAELEAAITAIDPDGKKLVPKALNHDHHFWFDMENQMIVAGFTNDIKEKNPTQSASNEAQSGAVLASAVLTAETKASNSYLGMRDVFNNGYYLIDSSSALEGMFGDMSEITKTNYASYISALKDATFNDVYGVIAEKVLENFKNTTVFNQNGVFYYKDSADNYIYFADGVKVISATHYVYNGSSVDTVTNGTLPAPKDGTVDLPSSVVLVEENALDFGNGNTVVVNTTLANQNAIADVFAPLASDATIKDKAGVSYKIVQLAELPEGDTHEKDRLVLSSDSSWMADLIVKLPFEDFTIGYTEEDSLVEFNTDTLYVSNLKNNQVILFAKDTASNETSLSVYKWESSNPAIGVVGGVLSFDIDAIMDENAAADSHRATIKAYAKNINGENLEKTLKVELRVVDSATVKIGDYSYPLGQGDQHLSYYVSAQNHSISPVASVYWKQIENETLYDLRAGDLVVKDANGTICDGDTVSFGVDSANYSFTVSVDGRLETKFTVAVIDLTNAPFQPKFHHSSEYSPYYVGSGDEVKLSDLFTLEEGFDFQGATLTVYGFAEGGTDLYSVYEINNYRKAQGQLIWTETYDKSISKAEGWENTTIKFNTDVGYSHTSSAVTGNYDVVIEIAPVNDVAMIVHVIVVGDAKNVNKDTAATELYKEHSTSVILHDDLNVATGKKVVLGGHDFYGNGYVITADEYVSTAASNVLTDSLISINGGTVDNIYLDGPVYPVLNYDHNSNGFYVSGISATGTTTIKNSYVCGFRQPVVSSGSTSVLTVKDTTLRGGNYANLLIKDGNLNLHNVTTVQDQNGMKNTVAFGTEGSNGYIAKKSISVTGIGIGLERPALDSTITITGYLDQFNWIKNGQSATLPSLSVGNVSLNVNDLFGFIFNGLEMEFSFLWKTYSIVAEMGSVKYFINQDTSQDPASRTDGYVHAGIVFGELGSDAPNWTESVTINENGRTDGAIKKRGFDELKMLFSTTGLDIRGTMVYDAADYFGTDGLVVIWSHKDNRAWTAESATSALTSGHRYVNPTNSGTAKVNANLPIYQIGDNTDYPINYSGYNYGN